MRLEEDFKSLWRPHLWLHQHGDQQEPERKSNREHAQLCLKQLLCGDRLPFIVWLSVAP
jgi:hypothetical protein